MPRHGNWTRRAFLERAGLLGTVTSALPWALQLAAMGDAAAFSATDYKALVCVFMAGGNDSANTIVPFDLVNYDQYHRIRGGGSGRSAGGASRQGNQQRASSSCPCVHACVGRFG